MFKGHRVAVVIPAYNEGAFIRKVIQDIPTYVDHIIVVDDCSQDDTFAQASACEDSRVQILRTPRNLGLGGATLTGYRRALELQSDLIAKIDGDGQMPIEYLPDLLNALIEEGYDYAKGNRFLVGESLAAMPKHRLFGNIVLTLMAKLASGYWHIFDSENGYTAIKASALRALDFHAIHKRYFFAEDMLIQLNLHNFRVKDVPIPARYGEEESGINPFQVAVTFPFLFLKRFIWRVYQKYILRNFSPIALFFITGALLFLWGVVFGIYLWVKSALTGHPTPTGTVMLAVVPLILGFQLLLQALVLDIQETPK
jgi:glycosyltransferase involved in cell wall biosynthesis